MDACKTRYLPLLRLEALCFPSFNSDLMITWTEHPIEWNLVKLKTNQQNRTEGQTEDRNSTGCMAAATKAILIQVYAQFEGCVVLS